MRPQTLKKVRIRAAHGVPRDSGSVSPPALEISGDGKAIFVEKMRTIYGKGLNEQELSLKIEQLWNGLNQAQREKFIGKENTVAESPKVPVPMLERRNNCKAIAKVLDLKSAKKPTNSYSQVIKGRMKSWWKEGKMINSRLCPPSPPQQPSTSSSSAQPLLIINTEPEEDAPNLEAPPTSPEFPTPPATPAEAPKPPKKAVEKSKPEQFLKRKVAREPLTVSAAPPRFKKPSNVRLTRVVTVVSTGPRISYQQACQEYYRTLSQSYIWDDEPPNSSMMPAYASIVQGERLIREYKFGQFL